MMKYGIALAAQALAPRATKSFSNIKLFEMANAMLNGRGLAKSAAPACWLKIFFVFFYQRWSQPEIDRCASIDLPFLISS